MAQSAASLLKSAEILSLFLPDATKAPKREIENWLIELQKYLRLTYGIDITAAIAASDDGVGTADERTKARARVITPRDVLWMHLGEEGKKRLKKKYPGEEVWNNI